MKFPTFALPCLAAALVAVPAGAAALPRSAARVPVQAGPRVLTLAATRGTFAGAMASGESISVFIQLPGQHAAELDRLAAMLTDPNGNANVRYLTPDEFGAYFGADPVTYGRAIAALRSAGFVIDTLAANRRDIVAHASASRVSAFFATPLEWRVERGRSFYTARYEPQVPAALGAALVSGLEDYVQFHPVSLHHSKRHQLEGSFTPDDIAAVYNVSPLSSRGLDGNGVTIANATSGAANASDLVTFQTHFGLSSTIPLVSTSIPASKPLSADCGPNCDNGESSLDADSAVSIASGVTFHQVVAYRPSNGDFNQVYSYIVNTLGKQGVHLVTTSWGVCERDLGKPSLKIDENDLEQAVTEGQFWFSASGDNGTDDCDDGGKQLSVDYPGSSPYAISVGGTNVQGSVSNGVITGWTGETTWQYSNSDGASGGGSSIEYAKPAYQNGVTPNDGKRDVPDVALIADPDNDGVYLCNSGTSGGTCTVQGGWGGTSEATPMWVAMMAIIEQGKHGKALAEPHKRLYALAKSSLYHTLFHDIVSGNNGVPLGDDPYYPNNSFTGYNAGPGFDLTTGWGSFDGARLLAAY